MWRATCFSNLRDEKAESSETTEKKGEEGRETVIFFNRTNNMITSKGEKH